MSLWFIKNSLEQAGKLKDLTGLTLLESIILANRGISSKEEAVDYFKGGIDLLNDPFLFKQMPICVDYIFNVLSSQGHIRVIGDYDQDGVSSTVILVKALRKLAEEMGFDPFLSVSYAIPDRVSDGYGINERLIDKAIEEGCDLLLTCDNGIAAFDALDHAYEKQIPVIVTDHHQILEKDGLEVIPKCEAFLNPHSKDSGYPFEDLCGAGVALKLVQALFAEAGKDKEEIKPYLAYAAMGTICDLVPLQKENRIIVSEGLKVMNTNPDPGLKALLEANSWDKEVSAYTIGFIIGPCINASGRLMSASLGVELFLEKDPEYISSYAKELTRLNEERKRMTSKGVEEGLEKAAMLIKDGPILAVYLEGVHESICGLIAGRIKEHFNRPSLVFTDAQSEDAKDLLKGSGRSIESYNMFDKLNAHRDDYVAFGGHAMACGMTIKKEDFKRLTEIWNREAGLTQEDFKKQIILDAPLPIDKIGKKIMDFLDRMPPFGVENTKPIFGDKDLNVISTRLVGRNKNVLQIQLEKNGTRLQGVMFNAEEKLSELENNGNIAADICYQPEWNVFMDRKNLQLIIKDIRFKS